MSFQEIKNQKYKLPIETFYIPCLSPESLNEKMHLAGLLAYSVIYCLPVDDKTVA